MQAPAAFRPNLDLRTSNRHGRNWFCHSLTSHRSIERLICLRQSMLEPIANYLNRKSFLSMPARRIHMQKPSELETAVTSVNGAPTITPMVLVRCKAWGIRCVQGRFFPTLCLPIARPARTAIASPRIFALACHRGGRLRIQRVLECLIEESRAPALVQCLTESAIRF